MYDRDASASGLGQVISDFLGGRRVDPKDILGAAFEMFGMAGVAGARGVRAGRGSYVPGVPGGGGWVPGPDFPRAQARRARAVPPPDEVDLEQQRALLLARQELGFQPREPLTVADVERRRKDLARRHHPDLGGSVTRMSAINQAADLLVAKGQLG